ncbi:MAG: DUF3127 domain-containing protein [Candidatus Symbiothrix sp.]|jgi:hypothetical protein|nr:DUF3127 domain-containing protein [Candidatus Symbiothrix sp.]
MQLTAKLIQVLPLESGMGRNGSEWKKQSIILETDGQYPKKVCVAVWGDKINPTLLQIGNSLTIDFDVESREYNGRWYTDVKAWKVESAGSSPAIPPTPVTDPDYNFPEPPPEPQANFNDLPF